MNPDLVRRVWERARSRCEYCRLPARYYPAPFQIDHIISKQHRGETELPNLALSCLHCNARKGPNNAGIDPATSAVVRLYHPRNDQWAEHFQWNDVELVGRTAIGRVTIRVLGINEPDFLAVRLALIREGVLQFD